MVEWDGKLWPLADFNGNAVGIKDTDGVLRFPQHARLVMADKHDHSLLEQGFAPIKYVVERELPDYRRQRAGGSLHRYRVEVRACWGEAYKDHYEQLDGIWSEEDLKREKPVWILGWWNAAHQRWSDSLVALANDTSLFSVRLLIEESEIGGQPVLFLWSDGRLRPAVVYRENPENALMLELLQRVQPPADWTPPEHGLIDSRGVHWMQAAASWGRLSWLERVTSVKQSTIPEGQPPVGLAAAHGHASATRQLLKAGFKGTEPDPSGFDAMHLAIKAGHSEVVKVLIADGHPFKRKAADTVFSPINLAFEYGRDDIFGLLREKGAKVSKASEVDHTVRANVLLATYAARGAYHLVDYIIGRGVDVNYFDGEITPLGLAVQSGNPAVVKRLLSARAKVNPPKGWQPLQLAVAEGDHEIVGLLLEAGADPMVPSNEGKLPLATAVLQRDLSLIRTLIEAGADPSRLSAKDDVGWGPIELATAVGFREVVDELFSAGAECRVTAESADALLTAALRNDIPEMAILAFDACVSPGYLFHQSYRIGWVAQYFGAEAVSRWLEEQGWNDSGPPENYITPSEMDTPPRLVSGAIVPYSEGLYLRYGAIKPRVTLLIDEDGIPRFPKLSGDPIPPILLPEFLDYVARWRFEPARVAGEPVKVVITVPVPLGYRAPDTETYDLAKVDVFPRAISQPAPRYPAPLLRDKIAGIVELRFVVTRTGSTDQVHAISSTHPLLSMAAIEAVQGWRFEPAVKDGQPVAVRVRIKFPFRVE